MAVLTCRMYTFLSQKKKIRRETRPCCRHCSKQGKAVRVKRQGVVCYKERYFGRHGTTQSVTIWEPTEEKKKQETMSGGDAGMVSKSYRGFQGREKAEQGRKSNERECGLIQLGKTDL